jgi:hypothetical protein
VETPSGMVGKKAHTCHLRLPNALYSTGELTYDLDAQLARKESAAAAQREWLLRHTQCTSRYRFEPATREFLGQHATHSATRLGN